VADATPTRQRLLDAGMALFAQQGFRSTTVGEIEAAAGLQPRRGALYKHFASKQDLLVAAVRNELERAAAGAIAIADIDLGGALDTGDDASRPLLVAIGRWFLDEMDRLRDLTLVVEHDGSRMPDLTASLKSDMVDLSYRTATALLVAAAPGLRDPEATAVLTLGSLVALRRTAWTFGAPPLDLDDERALDAWADLVLASVASSG